MTNKSENLPLMRWEDEPSPASGTGKKKSAGGRKRPWSRLGRVSDDGRLDVDLDDESDSDERLVELERRSTHRKKLVGGLWPLELALLCMEHLQYSALLLALSMYWAFPMDFIKSLSFLFWINLDAWSFYAVYKGVYHGSKNSNLPSGDIGLNYSYVVAGWCAMVAVGALAVLLCWVYFRRTRRDYLHRMAVLLSAASWLAVFVALPALYAGGRVFRCRTLFADGTSHSVVDMMNEIACKSSSHTTLIVVTVLFVLLPLYAMLPVAMVIWIRNQLVSACPVRHEAYLKLKETEYGQGLNDSWLLGKWTLFAALKRRAVYYHPLSFLLKCVLCVAVWLSHDQRATWKTAQASLCVAAFGVWLLWSALVWRGPFRIRALNVAHYASILCLLIVSLLGAFAAAEVETPLMRGELMQTYLIVFNAAPVGLLLLIWCFLLWKRWRWQRGLGGGVWPAMFEHTTHDGAGAGGGKAEAGAEQGQHSRYLLAMLRAQQCLKSVKQCMPVLAPCHELARHIHIINAYCREAEQERDQLHSSLLHLLDELTVMHTVLLRKSIFADTSKASVRFCAHELHQLLPAWQKQLVQREKDFILMKPVKRRILLKLYVMSMFLSKCSHSDRENTYMKDAGSWEGSAATAVPKQRRAPAKKSVGVRFTEMDDARSVSSTDVQDYLRAASHSSINLLEDDGDTEAHDRFLQAIDDLLPEERARGYSVVDTFRLRMSQAGTTATESQAPLPPLPGVVEEEEEEEGEQTDQQQIVDTGV
eukprot:scpid52291/ scgid17279/ 